MTRNSIATRRNGHSITSLLISAIVITLAPWSPPSSKLLHAQTLSPMVYSQSGSQNTETVTQHLQKAKEYVKANRPELAIPEFAAAIAIEPNNLDAQANLGVLLYFTGHAHEAKIHLRAALDLDPKASRIQALLGTCEHQLGDLESARTDLLSAISNLQELKLIRQASLEIIEIDTALNDLAAATDVVNRLKAQFPTDPEVIYAAYRVYRDLSDEAVIQLSLIAPDSAQIHQAMAHELMRDEKTDEAIGNMRLALKINPDLPGGHFELGQMLEQSRDLGDRPKAVAEYQTAVAQQPSDVAALTELASALGRNGQRDKSITYYKQALAAQASCPEALIGLANELNISGSPEQALPLLLQVTKNDPTNVLAHYRLIAVYRNLHKTDEAKQEVVEYEHLKKMKEKLQSIFDAMRISSPREPDANM